MATYIGTIESVLMPGYDEVVEYPWWQDPSTGWEMFLSSVDGSGHVVDLGGDGLSTFVGDPDPLDLSTGCHYEKGFAETHYWMVWCYPRRLDFGTVQVGAEHIIWVVSRYDDVQTLASEDGDSPDFEADSADLVPIMFYPLYERETLMTVISQEHIVESGEEYRFTFAGDAGIARIDLSVVLAVLYQEGAAAPFGAMQLRYKFSTEVKLLGSGRYRRAAKLAKPVREVEMEVMAHEDETGAVDAIYQKIPDSGKVATIAPLWCFWERLSATAPATQMYVEVEDSTEFEEGGLVILIATGAVEIKSIDTIVGNTLNFLSELENTFVDTDTWAVPGMTGIGTVREVETIARSKVIGLKFEVQETVVKEVYETGTVTSMTLRPAEDVMTGSSKPDRKVIGKSTGVPGSEIYNTDQRTPMIYRMVYRLTGTTYRTLRDAFVKCRGRELALRVPTWRGELVVLQEAVQGATSIRVGQTWYTETLSETIDMLWFDWYEFETQAVTVTAVDEEPGYVDITFTPSLPRTVPVGMRVSLMPSVHFVSDQMTLDFKVKNACEVEVGFVEEVLEEAP